MLQIREQQNQALAKAHYRDFERRAMTHLKKFFPKEMSRRTDDEIRTFVAGCVTRAKRYDLRSEQAVLCFAHLPLLLGDNFETNPDYRFVTQALNAEDVLDTDRAKVTMLLVYELRRRGLLPSRDA